MDRTQQLPEPANTNDSAGREVHKIERKAAAEAAAVHSPPPRPFGKSGLLLRKAAATFPHIFLLPGHRHKEPHSSPGERLVRSCDALQPLVAPLTSPANHHRGRSSTGGGGDGGIAAAAGKCALSALHNPLAMEDAGPAAEARPTVGGAFALSSTSSASQHVLSTLVPGWNAQSHDDSRSSRSSNGSAEKSPEARRSMPGEERLGVYEFVKVLGRGAEGTAFLVRVVREEKEGHQRNSSTSSNALSGSSGSSGSGSISGGGGDSNADAAKLATAFRVAKVMEIAPDDRRDAKKAIDRARSEAMCLEQIPEKFATILGFFGSCEGKFDATAQARMKRLTAASVMLDDEQDDLEFSTSTLIVLVLEYCDALDLRQEIKSRMGSVSRGAPRRLFAEREALLLFVQIALAIARIHSLRMSHRDLKTGNVFLMQNGLLKVGDFGFARDMGDSVSSMTICGTPQMMAPEVWSNKRYGMKVDVWSMGIVLFEILTLERPFDGASIPQVEQNILTLPPRPLPPTISTETRALVDAMLCKDPRQRPSALEVLQTPLMRAMLASLQMNGQFLGAYGAVVHRAVAWARSECNAAGTSRGVSTATNYVGQLASTSKQSEEPPDRTSAINGAQPPSSGKGGPLDPSAPSPPLPRPGDPKRLVLAHALDESDSSSRNVSAVVLQSIGSVTLRDQPQGVPESQPLAPKRSAGRVAAASTTERPKQLAVLREGFAFKLSAAAQQWKRRFFRLLVDTDTWQYYLLMTLDEGTEPLDGSKKGEENSSGARCVAQSTAALPLTFVDDVFAVPTTFLKSATNALWVHSMRYPKFFMRCESAADCAGWIDALRSALLDDCS